MGCGAPPPPPASRFCKDESLQPLGFDQCLSGLTDCYVTLRTTAGLSLLASNGNAGFFGSMWSIYRCALAVGSCSNLISSPTVSCYSTSVDIARGILPSGSGSLTCSPLMLCNETPVIAPCDPNEIIGPPGYSSPRFVSVKDTMNYTIYFENDPLFASASAQRVYVSQKIDSSLDPLTFRIKEFGFGPYVFNVPFQPPYYQTVLALQDTADIGVDVHFTAGVDVSRNELFWDLRSIDRNTGLPPSSATLGFLKVNDSTGRGEGYLKYLILPKANSRTGDLIQASAEIQFDVNQFINTNVEEHTIDSVPPKTRVLPLASRQDSTSFKIRWTTRDDISGSGLAFKRLYVSKDNQPFELVATLDAQDSLFWFTGVDQSSYGFYLLGVDHTGNQEATKIFAEATTRIASRNLAILQPTAGSSFCSGDSVTIVWDTTGLAFLNISLSFNNGLSFQNIATGISSSLGFYKWRIPQGFTAGSYTFRISDTSNSVQALSGLVNIRSLGLVNLGLDRISCGNPLSLGWNNPQSGFNYLWNNGEVSSSI